MQQRDEALVRVSQPLPPKIIEVVPPELQGVREAVVAIPEEHRKNYSIADTIRLIYANFQEAGVAMEKADQELKVIKKEKEELDEELKKERRLHKIADDALQMLREKVKSFKTLAKKLVKARGKPEAATVIDQIALHLDIPLDGMKIE